MHERSTMLGVTIIGLCFALLLAACVPVTPGASGSLAPIGTPFTSPLATPAPGLVAGACPEPADDLQRLLVPAHGYCLTYPAEYKVEKPNLDSTLLVIGGLLNAGDPRAHITIADAQGTTLEAAAAHLESGFPGFALKRSAVTVGGEPAVVLDGLPGQDINRRVLFVHEGLLYELYFAPAEPSVPAVYARLERLYAQVLGSFTFIPRSSAAVDDCLSPAVTTRLLTDARRGFCVLYPAGFGVSSTPDGGVVLAADAPGQANGSKVVIEVQDAAGRTAEQVADDLAAEAEKATPGLAVDRPFGFTIGYEPAALLDGMPGAERHMLAVHSGKLYRLIFTPADQSGAAAYAQMQALFELVVRSFRFLPPDQ